MSKIKVDTIQSNSENVELAPNGTGLVEVKGAGGGDGTVKLVSSNGSNSVKIKSPPHSASQSQTIILPDNSITQNAFLKVKSVSGSSPDKVGQLEYASIAEPDLTNLNASNFTSGTVPAARFPSLQPATSASFQLVQKAHVTTGTDGEATSVADITMSLDEGTYYVLGKHLTYTSNYGNPEIAFNDSSGSPIRTDSLVIYGNTPSTVATAGDWVNLYHLSGSNVYLSHQFEMWIYNSDNLTTSGTNTGWSQYYAMYSGYQSKFNYARCEAYMMKDASNANSQARAYSFTIRKTSGSFAQQTQILLYKLLES